MSQQKILVIDDDLFSRTIYADILKDEGYDVTQVAAGKEAFKLLENSDVGLVLTDMVMPEFDGLEVIQKVKQGNPSTDIVVITGNSSVHMAVAALKGGASDYLTKPVNPEELKLIVKRCFEQKRLFAENSELRGFIQLFESCQRISACLDKETLFQLSADALIQETGAKKGVFLVNVPSSGKLDIKIAKGIKQVSVESLQQLLRNAAGQELVSIDRSRIVSFDGGARSDLPKELKKLREAMLIPVRYKKTDNQPYYVGHVVIFKEEGEPPFSEATHNHALFLEKQICLAFENAEKYVAAKELAYIDDLTGCYNSRYLEYCLKKEIERSQQTKGQFAVLFIDLDYFKQVNDVHGHLVGSKLLVEVARVITNCVREVDIVTRYGGDEFTLVLTNTDSGGALKVAERIRGSLENHTFLAREDLRVRVTSCIGIACFPEHAKTVQEIIHMADLAMYRGKKSTRNVVYVASVLTKDELTQTSPTPARSKKIESAS